MSFYLSAVRNPMVTILSKHLDVYPTAINLTYL